MFINGKIFDFNKLAEAISEGDLSIDKNPKLASLFQHFDTDKNKKLDKNELEKAFSVFQSMDNSNNDLTEKEIKAGCENYFKNLDVKAEDLKNFILKLSNANVKNIAEEIATQIKGWSLNDNTKNKLSKISKDNVLDILNEYKTAESNSSKESLLQAIEEEWGLDINTIKEYVCKPLAEYLKENFPMLAFNYENIKDVKQLESLIDKIVDKITNSSKTNERFDDKTGRKLQETKTHKIESDGVNYITYENQLFMSNGKIKRTEVKFKYSKESIENYIINDAKDRANHDLTYFDSIPAIRNKSENERTKEEKE